MALSEREMHVGLAIIHPEACPGLRLTNGPSLPWHRSRQARFYHSYSQSSATHSSSQLSGHSGAARARGEHKPPPYSDQGVKCVSQDVQWQVTGTLLRYSSGRTQDQECAGSSHRLQGRAEWLS